VGLSNFLFSVYLGVIASSVGFLLKQCGLKVTAVKIDPYLNIDAGTFSPYEHGRIVCLSTYKKYTDMPF
jgi:CTP synthase (UTP-ammonia lyase)